MEDFKSFTPPECTRKAENAYELIPSNIQNLEDRQKCDPNISDPSANRELTNSMPNEAKKQEMFYLLDKEKEESHKAIKNFLENIFRDTKKMLRLIVESKKLMKLETNYRTQKQYL